MPSPYTQARPNPSQRPGNRPCSAAVDRTVLIELASASTADGPGRREHRGRGPGSIQLPGVRRPRRAGQRRPDRLPGGAGGPAHGISASPGCGGCGGSGDGTSAAALPTAAAFGLLLVTEPTDIGQRLAAGRVYQHLHLWATSQGLAMQPLNQLVERAERERSTRSPGLDSAALTALVADASWEAVMPFRVGYPTSAAPVSPRRAIDDVLIEAR